jgi:hypothetical protein
MLAESAIVRDGELRFEIARLSKQLPARLSSPTAAHMHIRNAFSRRDLLYLHIPRLHKFWRRTLTM